MTLKQGLADQVILTQGNEIGQECFSQPSLVHEYTYVCHSTFCYAVTLSKKDYSEVLQQSR